MLVLLAFVAVNLTVYCPALDYVCGGLCSVEDVLSPKLQSHFIGAPVLSSWELTDSGSHPREGLPRIQHQTGGR